jgi:hypothetical protein
MLTDFWQRCQGNSKGEKIDFSINGAGSTGLLHGKKPKKLQTTLKN